MGFNSGFKGLIHRFAYYVYIVTRTPQERWAHSDYFTYIKEHFVLILAEHMKLPSCNMFLCPLDMNEQNFIADHYSSCKAMSGTSRKRYKGSPVWSHEDSDTGMERWASVLTLTIGKTRTAELSALSAGTTSPQRKFLSKRRPDFTPKEIPL